MERGLMGFALREYAHEAVPWQQLHLLIEAMMVLLRQATSTTAR
jgi:hypothetical protein